MISVDVSQLLELAHILGEVATRPKREAASAHAEVAGKVASEAKANAASYRKAGTGRLAASIQTKADSSGATIWANPREAFFLEYGSPNTGPPRRWLSGPAEDHVAELGEKLQTLAEEAW